MTYKISKVDDTFELRQTFEGERQVHPKTGFVCSEFGQMLVVVTDNHVRVSMNGPCNMSDQEFNQLYNEVRRLKCFLRDI